MSTSNNNCTGYYPSNENQNSLINPSNANIDKEIDDTHSDKDQITKGKQNSVFINNENTTDLELKSTNQQSDIPSNHFQKEYLEKVKTLEHLIDVIKENAYEKNKKEFEEKIRIKNELETNVEILSSYVKLNRLQRRNFGILSKGIVKENERLMFNSEKAVQETDFFQRQIPFLKTQIDQMKNEITSLYEETKELKNQKLLLDRKMFMLNDEIKRFNKLNSDTFSEKENLKNAIKLLKKHSVLTLEKIKIQEEQGKEFFSSLTLLAQKAKMENDNYTSTRASFTKSI